MKMYEELFKALLCVSAAISGIYLCVYAGTCAYYHASNSFIMTPEQLEELTKKSNE